MDKTTKIFCVLSVLFFIFIFCLAASARPRRAIVIKVDNNQRCITTYTCNGPIKFLGLDPYGEKIYGCQEKTNRRRKKIWSQIDLKVSTECKPILKQEPTEDD